MNKSLLSVAIILGVGFTACTRTNTTELQTQKVDTLVNKATDPMKNLISIVEIPTTDFPRAVAFYQAILNVSIEEVDMGGIQMGVFPSHGETVNVALIKGDDAKPSVDGAVVYLNAGNDLQITLNKIQSLGGKVITPKTEISPEMGFYAIFIDTEGNKLGLHSVH